MLTFTLRRLLMAIPTLLLISLVIFLLVDFAPGTPLLEIPLTVPPEVRLKMIKAMGADQPVMVRYQLWLKQFFHRGLLFSFPALRSLRCAIPEVKNAKRNNVAIITDFLFLIGF